MSDREMLEFAAKAAGMEDMRYASPYTGMSKMLDPARPETTGSIGPNWNPIADDGDALRLAVKLNLAVVFHPVLNQALCRPYHTRNLDSESREDAEKHADPYAATRRAIVRAAAEIGRQMP